MTSLPLWHLLLTTMPTKLLLLVIHQACHPVTLICIVETTLTTFKNLRFLHSTTPPILINTGSPSNKGTGGTMTDLLISAGHACKNQIFVDICLPFGLRSAPKLFSILELSILEWQRVSSLLHCLDDLLLMALHSHLNAKTIFTWLRIRAPNLAYL